MAVGAALSTTGCMLDDVEGLSGDVVEIDLSDIEGIDGVEIDGEITVDVEAVMRFLFPDLTDEEIAEFSAKLTLEEVAKLKAELEETRKAAASFTAELFVTASERNERRTTDLADFNSGYPIGAEAIGRLARWDSVADRTEISLSGVFDGQAALSLSAEQVGVYVDGVQQSGTLQCLAGDETVDIVLLVDITGSMSDVIHAVRDSVVSFVDSVEDSGLRGTISVVTFQDSVGVNVPFQEPADLDEHGYVERSPFFEPVSIASADGIDELQSFVKRLEANAGADAPENLAGAVDFARNNVIGSLDGAPNVVDGDSDVFGTEPFPTLTSDRQVFIALTDSTFHADSRTPGNSSLAEGFEPRAAAEILNTLHKSGTVVHVVDPSWVDVDAEPEDVDARHVDADYWASNTGGLGEDVVEGYSVLDLERVIMEKESGLLAVTLDAIVSTSCTYSFEGSVSASSEIEIELTAEGEVYSDFVGLVSF